MGSLRGRFLQCLGGLSAQPRFAFGLHRGSQVWHSTISFDEFEKKNVIEDDDFMDNKKELEPQGVDPKRGWGFRGVHKAIICGKIGQSPVQKILRNGRTVTIFTVGTGGMFDQRIVGAAQLPRPAQWHRVAVHNEQLGAYAVQQLLKNSAVFVEGDIETRVYNDSITGQIKNIPEICVRHDAASTIKPTPHVALVELHRRSESIYDDGSTLSHFGGSPTTCTIKRRQNRQDSPDQIWGRCCQYFVG